MGPPDPLVGPDGDPASATELLDAIGLISSMGEVEVYELGLLGASVNVEMKGLSATNIQYFLAMVRGDKPKPKSDSQKKDEAKKVDEEEDAKKGDPG